MSDGKRYDVTEKYIGTGEYVGAMVESATGDWVEFTDYDALKARLAEAERQASDARVSWGVLSKVVVERKRQNERWGPAHDDEHSTADFVRFIEHYAGLARDAEIQADPDEARKRLVQVAALAVAAAESIERKFLRCPAPLMGDDGTVADCIAKGHCGCDARDSLTGEKPLTPSGGAEAGLSAHTGGIKATDPAGIKATDRGQRQEIRNSAKKYETVADIIAERDALKARLEALEATLTDLASPDFMAKYRKLERDSARLAEATAFGVECQRALETERARLAEAERLLDSGMIRLIQRDEFGQVGFCLFKGIDLRACIAEAIESERPVESQPGSPHFDGAAAYDRATDSAGEVQK